MNSTNKNYVTKVILQGCAKKKRDLQSKSRFVNSVSRNVKLTF